jgi:hypothetical protein
MWLLLLGRGDFILRLICIEYTWKNAACTPDDLPKAREDHVYHRDENNVHLCRKDEGMT